MRDSAPRVGVVDYGLNNLSSMTRALTEVGAEVHVVTAPTSLGGLTHLVLPGVGAFAAAMANLKEQGWPDALRRAALEERVPLLGVCLGMQLLADESHEGGRTPGLGFVPGRVCRLESSTGDRVPHMGWNTVSAWPGSSLFQGLKPDLDFYFVHSYALTAALPQHVSSRTPFSGDNFTSSVEEGNVFGVQFHPEKSSFPGLALLRNFLAVSRHA